MLRQIRTSLLGSACAVLASLLAGCATEPSSTLLKFSIRDNESIVTGARERVVTNHRPSIPERYGQIVPQVVVCAEPSPDVAATIANSFGFGISLFGQGTASLNSAQTGMLVQLAERTASIQLIRDQMYRACEAYSNGAMSGTNYTLLMSRLNETMATLMLGETAGGAFGRSLTGAGGKASAESAASITGLLTGLQDIDGTASKLAAAEKKVADETAAVAAAQTKLDAKTCDTGDTACTEARGVLEKDRDAAKARLADATGQRNALMELLKGAVSATGKAGVESASVIAGGGLSDKPDEKVAKVLGRMQREFLRRDPSQALIEACLVELSSSRSPDANPDAAQRLFDLGVQKAEQNEGIESKQASAASFGNRQVFRSGLYDFCGKHLAGFADASSLRRLTLMTQDQEIEAREVEAKAVDARARAAEAVSKALTDCNALTDAGLKSECLRKVASLQTTHKSIAETTEVTSTPPAAPEPIAPQYLPSHQWVLTDASCEALKQLKKEPKLIGTLPKGKDGAADKAQHEDLAKQRAKLDGDATEAEVRRGKRTKAAMRTLDNDLTDKRSELDLAKTDADRRKAKAAFELSKVMAETEADELTKLGGDCRRAHKGYERLLPEVAGFNSAHQP